MEQLGHLARAPSGGILIEMIMIIIVIVYSNSKINSNDNDSECNSHNNDDDNDNNKAGFGWPPTSAAQTASRRCGETRSNTNNAA